MPNNNQPTKHRPFLKWAGGKFRLVDLITQELPTNKILLEPFVGAGSVFLNTDFSKYILADANSDLINLFEIVKQDVASYIKETKALFNPDSNNAEYYYQKRSEFNQTSDLMRRAVLFLYLNRHCYNGLCRYNSKNEFNVPFGKYIKPYFPIQELSYFADKAQIASFKHANFSSSFKLAKPNTVIYCDPPYAPMEQNSNFTAYTKDKFDLKQQELLAKLAEQTAKKHKIQVLISNHETAYTKKIYQQAQIKTFQVQRSINSKGGERIRVNELLAIFGR